MKPITIPLLFVTALSLAFAGGAKEVAPQDLPAKVFKTLVLLKGDTDFEEIEIEKEGGLRAYEAEWKSGGREHSATVDAEGTLLEREHSVSVTEIPEAVSRAIAKHLPEGGEREIELQMKVTYEAAVELDGQKFEITLTPGGEVIEKKSGSGEED